MKPVPPISITDTDLAIIISALREAVRIKRQEMSETIGLSHRNNLAAYVKYAAELSDRLEQQKPKRGPLIFKGH